MEILKVSGLHARYSASGPEILKGIDFAVEDDDFFAIIGPSGAGKSTLIRCINRLVEPSKGEVLFDGRNVTRLPKRELRRAIARATNQSTTVEIQRRTTKGGFHAA